MIYAYDLDGVLAEVPSDGKKSWRHMNGRERGERREELLAHYATAKPLFLPPMGQVFFVVTARSLWAREVTGRWLDKHHGRSVVELVMNEGARTIENVVVFKAAFLRAKFVTDYAEDNRAVVRGLRKVLPTCRVWHFKKGNMVLDYEAPI